MSAAAVLDLDIDTPIRGELLSTERLEQLAETIAAEHTVRPGKSPGRPLLPRLEENGRALLAAYRSIAPTMPQEGGVSPAAEWLVDNFHIVEEQVREIRDDLPPTFYKELPKLAHGSFEGFPRVYAIAWTFIEHTDSRFEWEALRRFVLAYQKVQPLKIGELWAIAISLRIVLVENLRRLVDGISSRRESRALADSVADQILGTKAGTSPRAAVSLESLPVSPPLLVQLFSRLRDQDPATTPALRWLQGRLEKMEMNADELVRREHQDQVATHVTVRNVITSMRLISAVDWNEFFESVSLVEQVLRDGTRVGEMDFPTRDRYRRAVEELARGAHATELEIAGRATELARQAAKHRTNPRLADPGYYLISHGRQKLEAELRYRVPVGQWLRRAWIRAATPGYIGTILLLTLGLAVLPAVGALHTTPPWSILVLALLWLVPASDLAVAVVNRDVTGILGPRPLPKLELKQGVPESLRTLIAVPILLTSEAEAREAVERLEVHYLGNADGDVRLALLSDWNDGPQETNPGDEAALAAAIEGIDRLNEKHGDTSDGSPRFFLFHRRRVFNEREGVWMGWERKRGKLHELNRLLRGATDTTFLPVGASSVRAPSGIRYVVTLDADTRLPRGAVRRLVGTMAHPLNHPGVDPATRLVVEGHAVLQPRVTATLPLAGSGTVYQRLFSGPRGIDPYAFAVSDVYQDLFDEGIYTGKGIYDVDAFERSLAGRIPDNTLLSHDLFEGLFARAGLISDIEIFEEFPGHYEVAASRQHRWARGDWQLIPWLLPRIPDERAGRVSNPMPAIGRWKILDNLRRSLSPLAAAATLVAAWILPGSDALLWTALVVASIALPGLVSFFGEFLPRRKGIAKRSFLGGLGSDLAHWIGQTALRLILLAHQAWIMGDAVLRTLWRLLFTRRRMLEWIPAAQARRTLDLKTTGFYRRMHGAVLVALAIALAVAVLRPDSAFVAGGFVLAWALSPLVARSISLPPRAVEEEPFSERDAAQLRQIARRTYRYFETFAGSDENWLPADNFQETPEPIVAHRTSPTNIGLALLSAAAAQDMGWAGTIDTLERLESMIASAEKLERFRGHLYNWYDTRTRQPLEPRYVSTVDSGNLAGHLIALRHACLDRCGSPAVSPQAFHGIEDVLELLRESSRTLAAGRREGVVTRRQIDSAVTGIEALLSPAPRTSGEWLSRLRQLAASAETLVDTLRAAALDFPGDAATDALDWGGRLSATIASHRRDAEALLAWSRSFPGLSAEASKILDALGAEDASVEKDAERFEEAAREMKALATAQPAGTEAASEAIRALDRSASEAGSLVRRLTGLAHRATLMVEGMDFGFLFDSERKLFSIGYRLTDGRLDTGYYDLLASEARLASFIAISRGDVPASHWFKLGRSLTPVGKGSALISWSGSMFEYLMPELVMESPTGSILDQTNHLVVDRQIRYGEEHTIPWGISESAYNLRDQSFTYQYSNFGISGLGLKRGLSEDLVVAPYATALAAMVEPRAAARNFQKLAAMGSLGRYGFYESADFTPSHLPEAARFAIVRAFMAHHQGMTVVALTNVLREGAFRARFHSDPAVQASELLLQERTPRAVAVARPRAEEVHAPLHVRDFVLPALRRFTSPHHPIPRTHLLSNGRYSVMMTEAGSGYSRWKERDVTRWREDATRDCWGTYVFLRETRTGDLWSAGFQPTGVEAESYEAIFSEDRVEIHRRDSNFATLMQVVVSPEDDAEIRQVSVTNLSLKPREIEVTSFAELALAPATVDTAHPAFSKLFVQTEFVPGIEALLAWRRPRESEKEVMWVAHVAAVEGETIGAVQYETDRSRFLGRGRTLRDPASMEDGRPLSNTAGSVLDPIVSLRRRFRLGPGATARIHVATIAAETRDAVLSLADKYREPVTFERTTTLAWTQAQVQLHHLGIAADEAHLFQRVANRILYNDPGLRAPTAVIARNRKGPSALWPHGISGDLPIVLVRIDHPDDQDIVRQLLRAHEYWRLKGLVVDLVISNEQPTSYGQDLRAALDPLIRTRRRTMPDDSRGGVFQIRADLLSDEDRDVLRTAARVVLLSRHGTLSEQVLRLLRSAPATRPPRPAPPSAPPADIPPPYFDLEFFNGLGGFSDNGREYVTILGERQFTPAPWINVVANPTFGFLVSESGSGYTWAGNSRSNQLTPWSNDPVSDPPGDAIYIRDERTGEIWTPTALPIRGDWPYVARHGQGYSRFAHESRGIALELLQFVPLEDPVKISRLTLENRSRSARSISVTAYAEWVLGSGRASSAPFLVTERDDDTGALTARNAWNEQFGDAIAFADLGGRQTAWTADRTEFFGRNGSPDAPSALAPGIFLSGRTGAGLEPCAALQAKIELGPGERAEVRFLLGQGTDAEHARSLVRKYREEDLDASLARVRQFWEDVLGALQVSTPDRSMDLMLNRWLLYQALGCRIWARTAFYQASGAYGFRDQLQDVMALTVAKREIAREHLLRAAGRQFREGDVQHWWHIPLGNGVRTRISDDPVWLPFAVIRYLEVTGDRKILDEPIPFLEGEPLKPEEIERYFEPTVSQETGTLFEHCARALDARLAAGSHGLPLMGTGDWNDGMNRVGREGKGESVWLGWFLHTTLWEFAHLAEARGEVERAHRWRERVDGLKVALEGDGWDGDWYRRAFFDDGTPLGSSSNTECRIDSIVQSWGVISGAADHERRKRAMAAVEAYLVRRGDGLVLLFTPPFDRTPLDPGYIKGYLPGIRENGGQYTHAALWAVIAFAALGQGDKAGELFAILNPINHASTRAGLYRYKVEPYVAAADIYAEIPHVGRGGWTWYTGSAGWMYRAGIEWILGFRLRGASLHLDPCIPRAWPGFAVSFRYHSARYELTVENPRGATQGVTRVDVDGSVVPGGAREIPLADDGKTHQIRVVLG